MRLAALLAFCAAPAFACEPPPAPELPGSLTVSAAPGPVTRAWYDDPTTIYAHGILGDAVEAATLSVSGAPCTFARIAAGEGHVFEDVAPHLADLTGDGMNEVIAVRSSLTQGAQLAVYGWTGTGLRLLDATPYIGQRNRWLAPVGAADLDGDGRMEIAWIDRPHLAKVLTVWRWDDGLAPMAAASGLTNHRIGERDIGGGIRDCGTGPEMIVATADWSRVYAVRLSAGALQATDLGPHRDRGSFAAALACDQVR